MNSKAKGKRGELDFCRFAREQGYDVRRSQQYCGAAGDADVTGLPGLFVEIKRRALKTLSGWLHKAACEAGQNELPAVFHRGDHEDWLVTMYAEHFFAIYREWEAEQFMRGE